jgi:hypothetical protein
MPPVLEGQSRDWKRGHSRLLYCAERIAVVDLAAKAESRVVPSPAGPAAELLGRTLREFDRLGSVVDAEAVAIQ